MPLQPDDFSRDELLSLAKTDHNITTFSDAKNPSKPSKQEIIDAITTIRKREEEAIKPDAVVQAIVKKAKLTKRQKVAALRKRLNALRRVIVTEKHNTQMYEKDDQGRMIYVTWGCTALGFKTTRVVFNTPWTIPVGAIENLEQVTAEIGKTTGSGSSVTYHTVSKYDVKDIGLPTKEELAVISRRQALRKSMN